MMEIWSRVNSSTGMWMGSLHSSRRVIAYKPRTQMLPCDYLLCQKPILTHWGRDKMDDILHTTIPYALSWMKLYVFRLVLHWSWFLWLKLTISQHWFWWTNDGKSTDAYMCLSALMSGFVATKGLSYWGLGGVSLHLESSSNEFSWHPFFANANDIPQFSCGLY